MNDRYWGGPTPCKADDATLIYDEAGDLIYMLGAPGTGLRR
jgi:hypothetical protein